MAGNGPDQPSGQSNVSTFDQGFARPSARLGSNEFVRPLSSFNQVPNQNPRAF